MIDSREQVWRGKKSYLHPIRRSLKPAEIKPSLPVNKSLELPTELNWEKPEVLQQQWMDKIKKGSPYAAFDIFQEYGIALKDGKAKFHQGGEIRLIEQIQHDKNHYGPLEKVFQKEIADDDNHYGYYNDSENRWRYYAFLEQNDNKFRVIGGGKMHWCETGRTYWSAMNIEFNSLEEGKLFLDNLQKKPRLTMELYLRTLLEDNFPKLHYDGSPVYLGNSFRDWYYPFDEIHGKLNMFTKDLTSV